MTAAVTCTALAGLVALAAYGGVGALAAAVLVVQALLLLGVYRDVLGPAGRQGAAAAAALPGAVALASDIALVARDGEPHLAPLAGILGLAFLSAILVQVVRRDGRAGLVVSFTASLAAAALVTTAAMLLAASRIEAGPSVVAATMAGVAAGAVAVGAAGVFAPEASPGSATVGGALVLGASAGAALGGASGALTVLDGACLGVGGAVCAAVALTASRWSRMLPASVPSVPSVPRVARGHARESSRAPVLASVPGAGVAVSLAGPVAFVAGRLLLG
jgi:hypothetical protein